MALRSPLLSIGFLLLPAAVSAATLDAAQSRYQGAVSCIDRLFYDGGHDVGDARREALITEFLAHYQLPAYDEARYAAAEGADIDMTASWRATSCATAMWRTSTGSAPSTAGTSPASRRAVYPRRSTPHIAARSAALVGWRKAKRNPCCGGRTVGPGMAGRVVNRPAWPHPASS
ncbi:hypothetical protein TUM18999_35850 [Pseudomonas tohonis]|uniref:Uncharacterized protein n=1 Tax=Pseudomonas tohonis TaxID=2725477 RepID=A0A6J4E8V3_9PSED|nr:hypothetical protein [Pseudomonas tohonis]BCG25394.1 hypothetical protein TUM18999_35850 [Pseudomonas tohonis]GJN54776.1 hypothetical protein TUM20286_45280 [Pseudomonas tohonis]